MNCIAYIDGVPYLVGHKEVTDVSKTGENLQLVLEVVSIFNLFILINFQDWIQRW